MTEILDILGLGGTAVDEIFDAETYPPADAKQRGQRRELRYGGVTAVALVAAARLGARCAYAGALGDDELSAFVLAGLVRERIDVSQVVRIPGVTPVRAFIVVARQPQTRTAFADLTTHQGAADDAPPADMIRRARVLLVDHYGIPGMLRAAKIALAAGIPVVADFEKDVAPGFAELLELADHLILPIGFAAHVTNKAEPEAISQALLNPTRKVVVLTDGERGCWYLEADGGGTLAHQPAFKVNVADTTGCGDVFHGAYAAGLVRGLDLNERVRLAAAAAALKATRTDGPAGVPHAAEVEALLAGE